MFRTRPFAGTALGSWRAYGLQPIAYGLSPLEVIPHPERHDRLAELMASAECRKLQILPVAVQQRLPGPVDVDGEAQSERLEADAVGCARILQAQTRHRCRWSVDGLLGDQTGLAIADDRRVQRILVGL